MAPQTPRNTRNCRFPRQTTDEHRVMCPGQPKARQERWSEAKHRLGVATVWAWQRDPQRDGQLSSSRANVGGTLDLFPSLPPGSLRGLATGSQEPGFNQDLLPARENRRDVAQKTLRRPAFPALFPKALTALGSATQGDSEPSHLLCTSPGVSRAGSRPGNPVRNLVGL